MAAASSRGVAGTTEASLGALRVDLVAGRATLGDRCLDLSQRQLELLALLVSNRNRVVSRAELSAALGLQQGRSVDVLLTGIRRKVGFDAVRNVPKRGWILMPQALAERGAAEGPDGPGGPDGDGGLWGTGGGPAG